MNNETKNNETPNSENKNSEPLNKEALNKETQKTETLIQIYKEDPVRDNLRALVHQMRKTMLLSPAILPNTPEAEEFRRLARENNGGQLKLPKEAAPIPSILKNKDGVTFFPVYTTAAQIPQEPKYDVIVNVPFQNCINIVMNGSMNAAGIAVNPFTDNLIFRKELLEALRREDEALRAGMKPVKLTPQQMKIAVRQRAEFNDFPARIYKEGAAFVHQLSDEREAVVNEIYQNAYQDQEYPYSEEDFSVMPLDISDELLLVRVDLPEVKDSAQLCHRIYVTLNPKNEELHYFTIERGRKKDQSNLCGIGADGRHIEYGEAPVEGAEIQRIMDIIEQQKEQTS